MINVQPINIIQSVNKSSLVMISVILLQDFEDCMQDISGKLVRKRNSKNVPRNTNDSIDCVSDYSQLNSFFNNQFGKCPDKRTYDSIQEAELVAARNSNKSGRRIGVYHCSICGFYHLTSVKPD